MGSHEQGGIMVGEVTGGLDMGHMRMVGESCENHVIGKHQATLECLWWICVAMFVVHMYGFCSPNFEPLSLLNYIHDPGTPFPKHFLTVSKKILTRLYRVFIHVYIHHFEKVVTIGAVSKSYIGKP